MTALRHDAHPGDFGLSRQKTPSRDCSHWCLPGESSSDSIFQGEVRHESRHLE
jgi:hypothetical protein